MIRIYSIPECPYCTELKEILTKEGIEFTDVNVNLPENEKEYDKIYEVTKSEKVPIVLVNNQLLVPDISFQSINEASYLVLKFLSESDTFEK
jgi:glutaredoxin 3